MLTYAEKRGVAW